MFSKIMYSNFFFSGRSYDKNGIYHADGDGLWSNEYFINI